MSAPGSGRLSKKTTEEPESPLSCSSPLQTLRPEPIFETQTPGSKKSSASSLHSKRSPPVLSRTSSRGYTTDPGALLDRDNARLETGSLQSKATTAVSLADADAQATSGGTRETYISHPERSAFDNLSLRHQRSFGHGTARTGSDTADSLSIRSSIPGTEAPGAGSIFGDVTDIHDGSRSHSECVEEATHEIFNDSNEVDIDFENEFELIGEPDENNHSGMLARDRTSEAMDAHNHALDALVQKWKLKRKHYLILSSAGKPIYTRHGDNGLISDFIGIIQTIISFFAESENQLRCFSSEGTKIVVLSKGPLHLVAISRLVESDSQIRLQLEALYMQILSTLTLPALTHIFSVRPSTDLSTPLQGTEVLLSSLADSFTRGSPSTLLSALECLKIRKSHRAIINNTFLSARVDDLLYGLIVAEGKLVSVIRPKKHSLHPGDMQLIFNMIFEADGVKAGGGDRWIPICLPGFNNTGYLYMFVGFLDTTDIEDGSPEKSPVEDDGEGTVAVVLISANKEAFFSLQEMRDALVQQLKKNKSTTILQKAINNGRPRPTDIAPGTPVRHFIFKSKPNVQFTMSSYSPEFTSLLQRRRLFSAYHALHSSVHSKHGHVRVQHVVSSSFNSLAWVTATFELYMVASPSANRNALSQSASKIVQWAQKEGERLFIIGGAVSSRAFPWTK
ncbi:Vacuolar fusion protein mon1 [Ascosphaera pollenicola]|nr:Vacuolar fusion protein mon1 [Ascosphaera pollenicola]